MPECQLYKYNSSFYAVEKDEANHFVNDFVESEIDNDYVSWLNFHSLEDRESIEKICLKLGVDKLSIESIYNDIRRPKVEEYPNYMFFTVKSALPGNLALSTLDQEQITFILGNNYLISFQEKSSDHFINVRDRIEKSKGKIRSKGTDFLLFRMLEAIIDNYFEVLERIADNIALIDTKLHISENKAIFKEIEIESISTLAPDIISFILIGLCVAVLIKIQSLEMKELNDYPNYIYIYFLQTIPNIYINGIYCCLSINDFIV
jgi:magnesium transporter